jgi:large subunit ribosomal protein L22
MKITAKIKHLRISPTKVRRLADLVRGKSVSAGLECLRFLPHRGARIIEKAIQSAKANADDLGVRSTAELTIAVASVDSGATLKRMQPHARGMGFEIKKRMSHVTIVLTSPSQN